MHQPNWFEPATGLQKAGFVVLLASGFAASSATGFFIPGLNFQGALIAAVVCGVVGGALYASERAPLLAGMVCGIVSAVGGMLLTYYWTESRQSVFNMELAISWLIGAVPGAFAFQFWAQKAFERSTHQSPEAS